MVKGIVFVHNENDAVKKKKGKEKKRKKSRPSETSF